MMKLAPSRTAPDEKSSMKTSMKYQLEAGIEAGQPNQKHVLMITSNADNLGLPCFLTAENSKPKVTASDPI